MQDFEKLGYSRDEVIDVILSRGEPRTIDFRFELIDRDSRSFITNLTRVEDCSISFDSEAEIKRTAKITSSQTEYYREDYMKWSSFGSYYWSML